MSKLVDDLIDKQFPRVTPEQRAQYEAFRAHLRFMERLEANRRWDRVFAFVDRTLSYLCFPLLAFLAGITATLVWIGTP